MTREKSSPPHSVLHLPSSRSRERTRKEGDRASLSSGHRYIFSSTWCHQGKMTRALPLLTLLPQEHPLGLFPAGSPAARPVCATHQLTDVLVEIHIAQLASAQQGRRSELQREGKTRSAPKHTTTTGSASPSSPTSRRPLPGTARAPRGAAPTKCCSQGTRQGGGCPPAQTQAGHSSPSSRTPCLPQNTIPPRQRSGAARRQSEQLPSSPGWVLPSTTSCCLHAQHPHAFPGINFPPNPRHAQVPAWRTQEEAAQRSAAGAQDGAGKEQALAAAAGGQGQVLLSQARHQQHNCITQEPGGWFGQLASPAQRRRGLWLSLQLGSATRSPPGAGITSTPTNTPTTGKRTRVRAARPLRTAQSPHPSTSPVPKQPC